MYAHLFVVCKSLVDFCNVDNEQYEDDADNDKPDMEQPELLARNAVLPCTRRIFRNDLNCIIFTIHVSTVSGCPLFPGFGSGRPWNNS